MSRHVFALLVLMMPLFTRGYAQEISKEMADSLFRSLATAKMDTNKVNNLLKLADYFLYTAARSADGLDSARYFITQANLISTRLNSAECSRRVRIYSARYNFEAGAFDTGKNILTQMISDDRRTGDIYNEALAWKELGDNIYFDDRPHASLRLSSYQHARELFQKAGYQLATIEAYKNIADVHLNQGKLELAERELLAVLSQYRELRYEKIHYTYDLLASLYSAKNDQKKELYYRLLVLQTMGQKGPPEERASLLLRIIRIYRNLGRFDKCIELANQGILLYKNRVHDDFYYAMVGAGAHALLSSKRYPQALAMLSKARAEHEKTDFAAQYINMGLGAYYTQLKQYNQAQYFYEIAFNYYKQPSEHAYVKQFCRNAGISLANIKIAQRQFKQAKKYVDFLLTTEPAKDQLYKSKLELAQFKIDSANGDLKLAIKHFERHKIIEDSLYNVTKSRQIAELDIQYETRQKEQSIRMLNTEAISKNAMLEKVNLQRNIILLALVLSCVFLLMAYRFYRYKQKNNESVLKSNKLIKSKNRQLEFLVEEKEWLLKEVHHRVKNNLHTIICLLESQAAFLENDALKAIEKSQHRIYAMSLIHHKLYQAEDIQSIDMASYIPELVQYLKDSFGISSGKIYFSLNIEQISLDLSVAVPVALIINEALTNSIKYAFSQKAHGEITISFLEQNDGSIILELTDNGIGMDENIEKFDRVSLGLQLIKGLANEIQGQIHIESKDGVKITIRFKKQVLGYGDIPESKE